MENIILKLPRQIRFLIVLILVIIGVFLLWRIVFYEPLVVPAKFLEANRTGVSIAENIVTLSKESAERIAVISNLDKEGKIAEALDLVYRELERNKEMREEAVRLSRELEIMAGAVEEINPENFRVRALQAINAEVSLMNRLINYNDYLFQLLTALRDKFLYNIAPPKDKIDELIAKINTETQEINELNTRFNEEIRELFQK